MIWCACKSRGRGAPGERPGGGRGGGAGGGRGQQVKKNKVSSKGNATVHRRASAGSRKLQVDATSKLYTRTDSMQTGQPSKATTAFRRESLLPVNLAKSLHNWLQLVGWVEDFQAVCPDHVLDFGLQGSLNV